MKNFGSTNLIARAVNQHGTNYSSNNNVGGWQYIKNLYLISPLVTEGSPSPTDSNFSSFPDFMSPNAQTLGDSSSDLPEILSEETFPDDSDCGRSLFSHEEEAAVDKPILRPTAAAYCSGGNLRLYFQEHSAIYEVTCYKDGTWTNPKDIGVFDARPNTQLAVVSHSGATKIHLFYISDQNTIHERWWSNQGWRPGSLNQNAPKVSAFSALAATSSATDIHLFYQRGDTIYEHSYFFLTGRWSCIEVCKALEGTSIAATSCVGPKYLVFYQDPSGILRESVFGKKITWEAGDLPAIDARPYTPLATISWHRSTSHIRLYYIAKSGHLLELSKAREWHESGHDFLPSTEMEEDANITVVQKNDGQQIKTYSLLPGRKLRQRAFSRTSSGMTTKDIVLGNV